MVFDPECIARVSGLIELNIICQMSGAHKLCPINGREWVWRGWVVGACVCRVGLNTFVTCSGRHLIVKQECV